MKKVLLVDNLLTGHHYIYAKCLSELKGESLEIVAFFAQEYPDFGIKQYVSRIKKVDTFEKYMIWIDEIVQIAKEEKIDVIHFLFADLLSKFLTIGFHKLKKYRLIGTFHQLREGAVKNFFRKKIAKKMNAVVVHTEKMREWYASHGIAHVHQFEYPKFDDRPEISQEEAKKFWNIPDDAKLLVIMGGTRYDKGLDLLLSALEKVKNPFYLLIAGETQNFGEEFILENSKMFNDRVFTALRFLSEDDFNLAACAADVLVLPYRKSFDGASGPLVEGVWRRKMVVGPHHGSLGALIRQNNIGLTFETENVAELAGVLEDALQGSWQWNETAEAYRNQISKDGFLEKCRSLYESL